jgi:hypothetical protein
MDSGDSQERGQYQESLGFALSLTAKSRNLLFKDPNYSLLCVITAKEEIETKLLV